MAYPATTSTRRSSSSAPLPTNRPEFKFNVFNDTTTCDTSPVIAIYSSAPANSCALVNVIFLGEQTTAYGHIQCEDDSSDSDSVVEAFMQRARRLTNSAKTDKPAASEPIAAMWALKRRLRTSQLFA